MISKQALMKLLYLSALFVVKPITSNAGVLTLTLDSPVLTGMPNSLVTFTGTLDNTSGQEVFLNGADSNLGYSELEPDFTLFFADAPLSLPDGTSYSGPLLSVGISGIAIPGNYFASFDIQGGGDENASDLLVSGNVEVNVSAVPEPPMGLVLWMLCFSGTIAEVCRTREILKRGK